MIIINRILVHQESVFQEDVTVLHSLHLVLSGRYAQLEGTLCIGGNHILAGIVHHVTVELERDALHRHRRAVVVDVAREHEVGVHPEVEVLRPVRVLIEGYRAAGVRSGIGAAVALTFNIYLIMAVGHTLAIDLIGQAAEFEVTGFIGIGRVSLGTRYDDLIGLAEHFETGHSRTVGHAHIAVDLTRHLASTHTGLAVDGSTFALVDALHLVVVGLLCEHRFILKEQLVQVGGYRVSPYCIVIVGMLAAQHAEEVVVAGRHFPEQRHAALAGLRRQFRNAAVVYEAVVLLLRCVNLDDGYH